MSNTLIQVYGRTGTLWEKHNKSTSLIQLMLRGKLLMISNQFRKNVVPTLKKFSGGLDNLSTSPLFYTPKRYLVTGTGIGAREDQLLNMTDKVDSLKRSYSDIDKSKTRHFIVVEEAGLKGDNYDKFIKWLGKKVSPGDHVGLFSCRAAKVWQSSPELLSAIAKISATLNITVYGTEDSLVMDENDNAVSFVDIQDGQRLPESKTELYEMTKKTTIWHVVEPGKDQEVFSEDSVPFSNSPII